jgi:phage tail-like protein
MSIMSNALSLGQAAAGADSAFQRLGLAMRFEVSFDSGDGTIVQLGNWSSCKGLKVDFKSETVTYGGEYHGEVKLPTQVTYSQVVLERAMEQGTSQKLQTWLGSLVANWVSYDEDGFSMPPTGSVQIVLFDVYQKPVATWVLENAYPVSWSGPDLDAKANAVAIEKLTLEHQGFLPSPAAG